MLANQKFTLRVTPVDRDNFAELARLFKRSSQSDAIRYVVRETLEAFHRLEETKVKPETE